MQDKLKKWIKETLQVEVDFVVEYPTDMTFGDYSTNVAMVCANGQCHGASSGWKRESYYWPFKYWRRGD